MDNVLILPHPLPENNQVAVYCSFSGQSRYIDQLRPPGSSPQWPRINNTAVRQGQLCWAMLLLENIRSDHDHRSQKRRESPHAVQGKSSLRSNHRPVDDSFLFEACCLISFRACSNLGVGTNLEGFLRSLAIVAEKVSASCPVRTGVAAMGSAMANLLYKLWSLFLCIEWPLYLLKLINSKKLRFSRKDGR